MAERTLDGAPRSAGDKPPWGTPGTPTLGGLMVELVCPECNYLARALEADVAITACRSCLMRWVYPVPMMIRVERH